MQQPNPLQRSGCYAIEFVSHWFYSIIGFGGRRFQRRSLNLHVRHRMHTGETALLVIKGWLIYTLIAGVLASPIIFFGRRRVHWIWWETMVFIIPFFIWMGLMFSEFSTGRKSLANLGEFVFISFTVPIAALVRVALGTRVRERVCAGSLFTLACLTAVGVFWLTPMLPE